MKNYKLGVGTFIVREHAKADLEGTLGKLAAIGYDGVELLGFFDRKPEDIRKILDSNGIVALGNHVGLTDFIKDAPKVIAEHLTVGCDHITISCPGDLVEARRYEELIDPMNAACRACVAAGITPLYHNHGFDIGGEHSFVDFILPACSGAGLRFEPDVGWMAFRGLDPVEYLVKYRELTAVVHFKDIYADDVSKIGPASGLTGVECDPKNGGFAFRPTGYGIVNTPRVLPYALQCEPDWFMVDHDLAYARDSFDDLKLSHDYMRALMVLQK